MLEKTWTPRNGMSNECFVKAAYANLTLGLREQSNDDVKWKDERTNHGGSKQPSIRT